MGIYNLGHSTLSIDFAALKAAVNTSVLSKDRTPTPLATFLLIYTKANDECYVDYMEGAKRLIKYLAPIEIDDYYSDAKIPGLLSGYESYELAKLLTPMVSGENIEEYLPRLNRTSRAIMLTMLDLLPLLQRT